MFIMVANEHELTHPNTTAMCVKIQAVKAPFYTPEGDEGEEEYVVAFRLAGLWRFVFLIL